METAHMMAVNQDMLIEAIVKLNEVENILYALQMLLDDSFLYDDVRVEEHEADSLSIGRILDRVRSHLTRHLQAKEKREKGD
jgi:hypothetical protein